MGPRRVPAALAAALLAGCVAYDGRSELVLMPEGTLYAREFLGARVERDGRPVEVRYYVDGRPIDDTWQGLDVRGVREGAHALVAVTEDRARAQETATRTLMIDRTPPVATIEPPPGLVAREGPFQVTVRFSEPLATPSVVATEGGPYRVDLAADGRSAVVTFDAALVEIPRASVRVFAADLAGNAARVEGSWAAPVAYYGLIIPQGPVSSAADVRVSWGGDAVPAEAELLANGVVLGAVRAPAWTFRWDTSSVPEGTYALTVRVPGWSLSPMGASTIAVDHTVPVLVSCRPRDARFTGLSVGGCVDLAFSEAARPASATVTLGGVEVPHRLGGSADPAGASVCLEPAGASPTLPAILRIEARFDQLAGTAACELDVPAWQEPASPLPAAVAPLAAVAPAASRTLGPVLTLAGIGGAGSSVDGRAAGWQLGADGAWSAPDVLGQEAPVALHTEEEGARATWLVPGITGTALHAAYWQPTWAIWRDAPPRELAGGDVREVVSTAWMLAWTEDAGDGGRRIVVLAGDPDDPTPLPVALAPLTPGSVASQPAAYRDAVAWIERSATGAARLRFASRAADGTWAAETAAMNADLGADASSPAVAAVRVAYQVGFVLAWEEGGRVLARVRLPGASWGPAVAAGTPGRTSRAPSGGVDGEAGLVVFLEEDAGGERVEVRRFDGASWTALASPGGVAGGRAGALAVGSGPTVAWTDADGTPHLALLNR